MDLKHHTYQVYGITIRSEIELPELITTRSAPGVHIRYGEVAGSRQFEAIRGTGEVFERPGCRTLASADAMCVHWDRVGTFLVLKGSEIIVEPEPGIPEEDLRPFLTGPVLSVLLHQRGFLVLHASAVVIGNAAVAFLGAKGDGKSTLAAHLQARGHRLIGDDIAPVQLENSRPLVAGGFPRIKLYSDSIAAVGEEPSSFPLIHRFVEKRSFQHPDRFSSRSVALRGLYVLCEAENVGLQKLGPAAAFIEIARHTYVNRYLRALDGESRHFRQCQQLVRDVPVWKLDRPHDFSLMDAVCGLLERNVRRPVGHEEPAPGGAT